MTNTKSLIGKMGIPLLYVLAFIPFFLWFPSVRSNFSLRSLGQICALTGAVLLSINFILATRFTPIENLFSGLNRVYVYHHLIGVYALILLSMHPVFIGLFYLKISLQSAFDIIFPPLTDFATWFGMAALLTMISFLILTLYVKLPYDIWKITHKFMGVTLILATVHILFIKSSITTNLPLRYYLLTLLFLALLAYFYRTLLGNFLVRRYSYKVVEVKVAGEVTEAILTPVSKKINYLPGQFLFIKFTSLGITKEEHPFSFTSAPEEPFISIGAKSVGNYTETLKLLKKDSVAEIEGPFGHFSYLTKPRPKQVWIAGGIGVTPFVSMAKHLSAKKTHDVVFFYVVGNPGEAVYLPLFDKISNQTPDLKVIPIFTKTQGRLDAVKVGAHVKDLHQRDILVCGPPPMMKSLRTQFNKIGIRNSHIFTEEFSLD